MATKEKAVEQAPANSAQPSNSDVSTNQPTVDAISTTQPTADEIAASAAKAVVLKAQAAEIALLSGLVIAAKEDFKKWSAMAKDEDPETKEYIEMKLAKNPNWLKDKEELVEFAEKNLSDYRISCMSDEEKSAATEWQNAVKVYENALAAKEAVRLKYQSTYPHIVGAKHVAPKTTGNQSNAKKKATGEMIPFPGTLNPLAEDTATVKQLVESGAYKPTEEVEITRHIYGEGFTISGDALASGPGGNPRARIHSIRIKLGYVPKKA